MYRRKRARGLKRLTVSGLCGGACHGEGEVALVCGEVVSVGTGGGAESVAALPAASAPPS